MKFTAVKSQLANLENSNLFLYIKKDFCYHGFDVMFNSVNFCKGFWYSIEVTIMGPWSCFRCDGFDQITTHGVTFSFRSCKNDRTTVELGQFVDFLFKLP